MKTLLHVLTQPADPLVADLLATQRHDPAVTVVVVDLSTPNATGGEPDYAALVRQVFAADSIAVW